MIYFYLFTLLGMCVIGCDEPQKETIEEDTTVDCGAPDIEMLEAEQESPVGTPQSLADWLNGEQSMPAKIWSYQTDSEKATMMNTVLNAKIEMILEGASYITYSSDKPECANRLTMTGKLGFHTSEQIFREMFDVTIERTVDQPDQATIKAAVPIDELSGSYDFQPIEGKYNRPTLYLETIATPDLTQGKLIVGHKYATDANSIIVNFPTQ